MASNKYADIKKTFGKKGSLHKATGTPPGVKIPKGKLAKAAAGGNKEAALSLKLNGGKRGK